MRRWTAAAVALTLGLGTIAPAAAHPPAAVAGLGGAGLSGQTNAPANTAGSQDGGPGSPSRYSPGLIVKYSPDVVLPQSEGDAVPGKVAKELELTAGAPVGLGWFEADLPEAVTTEKAQEYAERLMADPVIQYAEPQLRMRKAQAAPTPNDPLWNEQSGFSSYGDDTFVLPPDNKPIGGQVVGTNLLEGLGARRDDTPVVAVIDTGITNHPDLGGRLLPG